MLGEKRHGPLRRYAENGALLASQNLIKGTLIRERLYDLTTGRMVLQFDADDMGFRSRTRIWQSDAPRGAPPTDDRYEWRATSHGLQRIGDTVTCWDHGVFVWAEAAPTSKPCPPHALVEWDPGLPDGDEDYAHADGGL